MRRNWTQLLADEVERFKVQLLQGSVGFVRSVWSRTLTVRPRYGNVTRSRDCASS